MSQPIDDFRQAMPEIGRIIAEALARQRRPDPPEQDAIRSVFSAIDNTRMYLRRLEEENIHPVPSNPELVELWREASIKIAAFDQDLANRLRGKGEYWSDPAGWNQARIREANIDIDSVANDARKLLQLAVPKPSEQMGANAGADVFISHASEDKATVAAPLASELVGRGVSVWLDRAVLKLGDNLTSEIDKGLAGCRYGAVILSTSFFAKAWPRNEMTGLMALESADGRKRILPVWHQIDQAYVAQHSPLLAARLGISTDNGIAEVANAIQDAIS